MGVTSAAQQATYRRCQLDVDLMAAFYNAKRPERSFAMVISGRSDSRMVGVGSYLGNLRVVAVRPRKLWLKSPDAEFCWIPLSHKGKQPISKKRARRRKSRRKRR